MRAASNYPFRYHLTNPSTSSIRKTVKSTLRLLSLAIILAAVGYWIATGANRGWTKNQVPIKVVDEVTGIEGTTSYRKQFVPGVDFLAEAAAAAILCAGLSFLFRTKRSLQTSNEQTTHP